MRLLVTGASGFVGSHLARATSQRGDRVRCLVRPSSDLSALQGLPVEIALGDVTDSDSVRKSAVHVDAVVHCAATTSETSPDFASSHLTNVVGTKNLVEACEENGVRRFVLISSLSANEQNTSAYGQTKLQAERIVKTSSLRFTILRPSTVYGPGGRGLFAKIGRFVDRLPLIPIIGSGRQRFRPIYVADLVAAILSCLESDRAVGNTYDLGGLDGASFEQFIDGVCESLGKKRVKLHLPVTLCIGLAKTLALVVKSPPLTVDNILGITQMTECDISKAQEDFAFRPLSFREGIRLLREGDAGKQHSGLRHDPNVLTTTEDQNRVAR